MEFFEWFNQNYKNNLMVFGLFFWVAKAIFGILGFYSVWPYVFGTVVSFGVIFVVYKREIALKARGGKLNRNIILILGVVLLMVFSFLDEFLRF